MTGWKVTGIILATLIAVVSYLVPDSRLADHHAAIMLGSFLTVLLLCAWLLKDLTGVVQDQKDQMERLMGTNLALTSLIDLKDHYTEGHSRNVRDLARGFAAYLTVPPRQVEQISLAAQLHDIGKIGIPDAILAKPSRLTDEEYAEIKKHPDLGADAIQHIPDYEDIVRIIRHHHERFDGRGYPEGLAGTEIPTGSRLISLADTYDALIHGRAYRQAMSTMDAIREMQAERGGQFDPDMFDHFIRFLSTGANTHSCDDPVCGMPVAGADPELSVSYNHRNYFFCSRTCLVEFTRHPDKYSDSS